MGACRKARAHRVHANAASLQVRCPCPRERTDRGFGGAINTPVGQPFTGDDGRIQDDRGTIRHQRKRLLDREKEALHIACLRTATAGNPPKRAGGGSGANAVIRLAAASISLPLPGASYDVRIWGRDLSPRPQLEGRQRVKHLQRSIRKSHSRDGIARTESSLSTTLQPGDISRAAGPPAASHPEKSAAIACCVLKNSVSHHGAQVLDARRRGSGPVLAHLQPSACV